MKRVLFTIFSARRNRSWFVPWRCVPLFCLLPTVSTTSVFHYEFNSSKLTTDVRDIGGLRYSSEVLH